jgi:hypothetical protein
MQEKKWVGRQFILISLIASTESINAGRRAAPATVCGTVQIPTVTATSITLRY